MNIGLIVSGGLCSVMSMNFWQNQDEKGMHSSDVSLMSGEWIP